MKKHKIYSKPKILYLFRRPVEKEIKEAELNKYPHDFFYAFTKVNKNISVNVSDKIFKSKIIFLLDQLIIKALYSKINVGIAFFSVFCSISQINRHNLIYCTVDSYAIPYGFLKYIGIIKKPFVYNTIGLCDALIESRSKLFRFLIIRILKNCEHIISGASYSECKKLSFLTKTPLSKFTFIPFGIDTQYFYPNNIENKSKFILIIGADPKRDWDLYIKIISSIPSIKFVVITNKKIFSRTPSNVKVFYNLHIERVREWIWKSTIVLILSKQNYHFAGQSTVLRSMSCGKTVIFTKSYGVDEYGFVNNKNCILTKPNNHKEVVRKILSLYHDNTTLSQIGTYASELIRSNYNVELYSKRISELFFQVLKRNI